MQMMTLEQLGKTSNRENLTLGFSRLLHLLSGAVFGEAELLVLLVMLLQGIDHYSGTFIYCDFASIFVRVHK
jgi:hypothetical protein